VTVKRLFDILASLAALVLLAPLFAVVAIGIRVSSKGPVFYRALRSGRDGATFTMYKFRTMDSARSPFNPAITAAQDPRIFPFGAMLRASKIDELPQLINVLKGEMSIVGPRPEDPGIVERHYRGFHLETLRVLPGLASPGSLYNYTHGERILDRGDPERDYVERLLDTKLALDTIYVREASFRYDLLIILRSLWTIAAAVVGKRRGSDPPEMRKALAVIGHDFPRKQEQTWREEAPSCNRENDQSVTE
jgi:lipopolysaccharide/colanic/teichoic acid biosynthesis glycosyltransferase